MQCNHYGGLFLGKYAAEVHPDFVFRAHRLLYHSTLGLRVIKKKKYTLTAVVPRRARI